MLRMAVRRKSCGIRPGRPAATHAAVHALVKLVIGFGCCSPPRFSATIRKTTHGSTFRLSSIEDESRTASPAARRSFIGKMRPSPFFVVPASRRTSPAEKIDLPPFEREHFTRAVSISVEYALIGGHGRTRSHSPPRRKRGNEKALLCVLRSSVVERVLRPNRTRPLHRSQNCSSDTPAGDVRKTRSRASVQP
jgi:hypothetical protein